MFVVPFLIWLTFAIIEYGFYFSMYNTVTQLARDGGRYAAVHGTESTSDGSGTTAKSIRWYMGAEAQSTPCKDLTDAMVSVGTLTQNGSGQWVFGATTYGNRKPGTIVSVQVVYPIGGHLIGRGLVPGLNQLPSSITRTASFLLENPNV